MTTKEHQRECIPIYVQIDDGEMFEIGTVQRSANGKLNPYDFAAFFRAAAEEIERVVTRAVEELIDDATYQRWRDEEARHHEQ